MVKLFFILLCLVGCSSSSTSSEASEQVDKASFYYTNPAGLNKGEANL